MSWWLTTSIQLYDALPMLLYDNAFIINVIITECFLTVSKPYVFSAVPLCVCCRFTGSVELHNQSHGSSAPYRPAGPLRHHHLCHHRPGALHGQDAQDLLLRPFRYTHILTYAERERISRLLHSNAQMQIQPCMIQHINSYTALQCLDTFWACIQLCVKACFSKHIFTQRQTHKLQRDGHTGKHYAIQTLSTEISTKATAIAGRFHT